ncbi:MAG TPA: hypothetical protein VFL13_11890 [Candidatus Baltobacteraceae bacterium]|nr:hypothetical protein [Candidatus Baltobacteraceae bacterium]
MKLRLTALGLGLLLTFSASAGAATPKPTPAMMKPVQALLQALNTNSTAPAAGALTSTAVIVDEFAPFRWSGPSAASSYLSSFGSMMKAAKLSNVHGTLGKVTAFDRAGNRAYMVIATDVAATMNGKRSVEHGTWTFTLLSSGGTWQIDSVTWGTVSGP